MPKLFGVTVSACVRKVFVVLQEKGIAAEYDPVIPMNVSEEYKKISPLGKIPAYQDDKVTLADSSVITFYLEKTHPLPALYPTETLALTRALWFEEYADDGLIPALRRVFVEKKLAPTFLKRATDEKAVAETLEKQLPPMFAYLESQVTQNWLVENKFSIADIAIASGFVNFHYAGYTVDAAKYPKLAAYVQRVLKRPSFEKALAADTTFFAKAKAAA